MGDRSPNDFIHTPPRVPHLVANPSGSEPAVTILARTDPNEQEVVMELPDLDDLSHLRERDVGLRLKSIPRASAR